jgi:hypothetical protein
MIQPHQERPFGAALQGRVEKIKNDGTENIVERRYE